MTTRGHFSDHANYHDADLEEFPFVEDMKDHSEQIKDHDRLVDSKENEIVEFDIQTEMTPAPIRSPNAIHTYTLPPLSSTHRPCPKVVAPRQVGLTISQCVCILDLFVVLCFAAAISTAVALSRSSVSQIVINNQVVGWGPESQVDSIKSSFRGIDIFVTPGVGGHAFLAPSDSGSDETASSTRSGTETLNSLNPSSTLTAELLNELTNGSFATIGGQESQPAPITTFTVSTTNVNGDWSFFITTTTGSAVRFPSHSRSGILARSTNFNPSQLRGRPI